MLEVVLLDGGLGNNLFQLRYAWSLQRSGASSGVLLHAVKSERSAETLFLESAARELGLKFTTGEAVPGTTALLMSQLKRMLSEKRVLTRQRRNFVVTPFFTYRLHCGYWQSIPFVIEAQNPFEDAISGLLPNGSSDIPILHVRGGDYLLRRNARIYSALNSHYYRQAFSEIERRMKPSKYHIVSNDKHHVAQLLSIKNSNLEFSSGKSALDDFCEITRHNVIVASNSTFCWWGARIGLYKRQTDLVIAPRHWMNEGYRHRSHPSYSGPTDQVVLMP